MGIRKSSTMAPGFPVPNASSLNVKQSVSLNFSLVDASFDIFETTFSQNFETKNEFTVCFSKAS